MKRFMITCIYMHIDMNMNMKVNINSHIFIYSYIYIYIYIYMHMEEYCVYQLIYAELAVAISKSGLKCYKSASDFMPKTKALKRYEKDFKALVLKAFGAHIC
jgi:hypothetical protein